MTAVHTDNVFAATDPRDERARNVLAQAIRERDEARAALARGPLTDDEIAQMYGHADELHEDMEQRSAWIAAYRAAHAQAAMDKSEQDVQAEARTLRKWVMILQSLQRTAKRDDAAKQIDTICEGLAVALEVVEDLQGISSVKATEGRHDG